MSKLLVPRNVVTSTLASLQEAGRDERERVVLWLGVRQADHSIIISEAYVPEQRGEADFFQIPRTSIVAVFDHLRERGAMIAAQVHSHPGPAFHSAADDRWAIVRHLHAFSLVVPDFALTTETDTFLSTAAVFHLSEANEWVELAPRLAAEQLEVIS